MAVCFFLFSCTTGLGESIDLEAPVLEITSPRHGAYVPKTFTLEGTATDNKRVNRVEIEYKYKKNGETISGKEAAIISGEKWECNFSFDGEYEVEFEAYAYDALKNGSDNSHQRIMVLIDSQDPEANKMSIVRGDYVARLYPLERFTESGGITEWKNDPKNKDNFQNEKITLVTTLDDNYGIGEFSLDLYEVNPETKEDTFVIGGIPADSQDNKYSPSFTITEGMLPQNILTGLHYIRPCLNVADEAGNKIINKEGNVFAWESEYNRPHVSFVSMQSDGHIELQKDAPIIVTVFDDDKLKSCNYIDDLIKEVDFKGKDNVSSYKSATVVEGSRDLSFEIDTKKFGLGTYYIVMKVEDSTGRPDGIYFEAIPVRINNASAPVIIVDKPGQNTAPALTDGEFTIEGKVIDDENGLDKIAIAWLPNGNSDISKAEELFKDYNWAGDKEDGGIKIYKLNAKRNGEVSGNPAYAFSKTYNFFEDFKVGKDVHNENKVFMIAAKDPTGNLSTITFRLSKISSAPKFKVGYTNEDNTVLKLSDNLTFTPLANQNTKFVIEAYSDSNLEIKQFSVTGSNDNEKTAKSPYKSPDGRRINIEFNTDEANLGKVYKYTLSATDQIGGTSNESLTIQFDQFGVLQSITCESAEKTTFVTGETIRLLANFDYKVYVNGTPYIPLSGTLKDGTVKEDIVRAKYTRGSTTNTLYFEYKVLAGIECTKLTIGDIVVPEDGAAVLEGNIDPDEGFENKVDSKEYAIDSIAPYIKGMTPGMGGVKTKKDGTTTITFTFNEPVTIESGTVIIQRTEGWYIPPVISESVFQKIYNEKASDADKITLCSTANLSSDERFYKNTLIPKGPYMQYTNGIKEGTGIDANGNSKTGVMVPDLTTKYVLAYQYNIGDTTGKVAQLRGALERAGYHKAEIDASRMKVVDADNSTKWEMEIEDDDFIGGLVNGVEYEIIFKNFKAHDEAYNYYEGSELKLNGSSDSYKFWVGPVATPIIRVNRTATNGINDNPFGDGTIPNNLNYGTYTDKFTRAAQTTFKIDCETPGATVKYGIGERRSSSITEKYIEGLNWVDNGNKGDERQAPAEDIKSSEFDVLPMNTTITINGTSKDIGIGENSREISQKIYIKAQATKTADMGSAIGQEGAFKTVIHYFLEPKNSNSNPSVATDWRRNNVNALTKQDLIKGDDPIKTPLRIYGAQVAEGSSYTAGWPLTQNGAARSDYQIAYTNSDGHFYWVSWQILDNFTLQTYSVDFQEPANPDLTYGIYHYCKNKHYWALDY
ncbi:MAG: Ig-like domain-containing protein [Treponemataceae bacterium]|nr:Ig-like domain-containing protein [Treponemataceae bacterium]